MTLLEDIEGLNTRISSLDDTTAELSMKSYELRVQKDQLLARLILQESLLSATTWKVELNAQSNPYLQYTGKLLDGSTMARVIEMARSDYHSSFELTDMVTIRFDDSDITLTFTESGAMLPFVQMYGLVIDGISLVTKLIELKESVAALELTCQRLGL